MSAAPLADGSGATSRGAGLLDARAPADTRRPRLLDLFCGQGGAATGYDRAGFDVVGVDREPQPHYPFRFWQADVLTLEPWVLAAFDAVHASPPCQAYSALRTTSSIQHPQLIEPTRELLRASGRPYVIENVPGAPLLDAVVLCGGALGLGSGGRHLQRHRLFEASVALLVPPCHHFGHAAIGVYGHGRWQNDGKHRGGYQGSKAECAEAMGMEWATRDGLAQAIPPAYTELIGHQLIQACS